MGLLVSRPPSVDQPFCGVDKPFQHLTSVLTSQASSRLVSVGDLDPDRVIAVCITKTEKSRKRGPKGVNLKVHWG